MCNKARPETDFAEQRHTANQKKKKMNKQCEYNCFGIMDGIKIDQKKKKNK